MHETLTPYDQHLPTTTSSDYNWLGVNGTVAGVPTCPPNSLSTSSGVQSLSRKRPNVGDMIINTSKKHRGTYSEVGIGLVSADIDGGSNAVHDWAQTYGYGFDGVSRTAVK